jgi:hypothetical protein
VSIFLSRIPKQYPQLYLVLQIYAGSAHEGSWKVVDMLVSQTSFLDKSKVNFKGL